MPKKLARRRRALVPASGEIESVYCRKCMKQKSTKEFYSATDKFLDTNGYLSICKECVSGIYVGFYNVEHTLDRAIYKTCQAINVIYSQSAVDATRTHVEKREKLEDDTTVFGIYKTKILSTMRISFEKKSDMGEFDLSFRPEMSIPEHASESQDFSGAEGIVEFWGDGYGMEEYRFLEKELSDWKRSYSCQNKAEEFFLKQICLKSLELENAKKTGRSGDAILKSMQDLLKNAALTPAQQTASSSGKGVETWGMFIKNIEETTPAEYYKDKELFKDVDDLSSYLRKFLLRPLKNFVTGSRDFNIVDEDTTEYDEPELEVENGREEGKTEPSLSG